MYIAKKGTLCFDVLRIHARLKLKFMVVFNLTNM